MELVRCELEMKALGAESWLECMGIEIVPLVL
jgi:hypothetical protein